MLLVRTGVQLTAQHIGLILAPCCNVVQSPGSAGPPPELDGTTSHTFLLPWEKLYRLVLTLS